MKTVIVHHVMGDPKVTYRAHFESGGYRDCDSLQEAKTAWSPLRGSVVRVERVRIDLLWTPEHSKENR